jgi:hypothetical protein
MPLKKYLNPTMQEMLYGKKPTKQKKTTKKPIKTSKKKFTLTQPTGRLIIKEVGKCENCNDKKSLEVHHIKKVSDGGGNTPNNLIVLCHECHKDKAHRGSFSATEQRKKIRKRSVKLQNGIKVILDKAKKRQKKTTPGKKISKSRTTKRKKSNQVDDIFNPTGIKWRL